MLLVAGLGVEAAIGQLTRLTKLHLSVNRDQASRCIRKRGREAAGTLERFQLLQLQLLGTSETSGGASRNTSLQNLKIECSRGLSDNELVAAAGALSDLRQLEVIATYTASLRGPGLAALSACRRLQVLKLKRCADLDGRQLAVQLPELGSLATLQLTECPMVDDDNVRELQTAFRAKHDRHLPVFNAYGDEMLF